MFGEIYPLLNSLDSSLSSDAWQVIFDVRWNRACNHCGYGLFDDEIPVGFLGMVFSQRHVDQKSHNFCNLTSWIVRPDYRSHSVSMMMPVMRLKDHTITDLSASETVVKLSKRLGFQTLDTTIRVLIPYWSSSQSSKLNPAQIYSGNEIDSVQLSHPEQTIFSDHQSYVNCHQIVLRDHQAHCHLIYTCSKNSTIPYAHIQSITNIELFQKYQAQIRHHIIQRSRVKLIVIDSRLVSSITLPFSIEMPMKSPRLYCSEALQPEQIDNLYSEYILLDVNTDLSIRTQLAKAFPLLKSIKKYFVIQHS